MRRSYGNHSGAGCPEGCKNGLLWYMMEVSNAMCSLKIWGQRKESYRYEAVVQYSL